MNIFVLYLVYLIASGNYLIASRGNVAQKVKFLGFFLSELKFSHLFWTEVLTI
jgi:hypothetical protein